MRQLWEVKNSLYKLLPMLMVKLCLDIFVLGILGNVFWRNSSLYSYGSIGKYLLSWVLFAVLYECFRKLFEGRNWRELRFSDYLLVFLGVSSVLPGLCLYGKGCFSNQYFWFFCYFWLTLLLASFYLKKAVYGRFQNNFFCGLNFKYGLWIFYFIAVACFAFIVYTIFVYNVHLMVSMSLTSPEIYEQRAYFKSIVKPVWLNYVFGNLPMINLWCTACFLDKRKYPWLCLSMVSMFLLYSMDGGKVFLLGMIAFIGGYVIWPYLTWKRLAATWCGINVFIFAFIWFSRYIYLIFTVMYRRMLFLPALLGSYYFSFFLQNAPMYFNRGMYPDLPYKIGEIYLQEPLMSANNGLTAEAMAMWGLWGCVVQGLILAVFFMILDFVSSRVERRVLFGMSIFMGSILINSFLRTSLLSHGLLVSLLMMLCWPVESLKDERGDNSDAAIG